MTPLTECTGRAVSLPRANIDTDQIIPARFLRRPRSDGYDNFLFADLRQEAADFALNRTTARILVTGPNFGCGSSREGAVYALVDAGITCVIAESFGDIFAGNARKNGLLALVLPADQIARIQAMLPGEIHLDLPAQRLHLPDQSVIAFDIHPHHKRCLVEGLDEIGITLTHADRITAFQTEDAQTRPWATPG